MQAVYHTQRGGLTDFMAKAHRQGICKLTGKSGQYVDSHIIPLALTRLSGTGQTRVQMGIGLGVARRANSWYDRALVTQAGEEILARIDWKAIEELRSDRLVWSGWGPDNELNSTDLIFHDGVPICRAVPLNQPKALQLFFLSLLWRSAVSTRVEFSDVRVEPSVLEDLRTRVLNEEPGACTDYPVQLFQIITRGPLHNRTPLLERKSLVTIDGLAGPEISYARFYFDGLIAHVHLPEGQHITEEYLNTCLRYEGATTIFTHNFESSRTAADIAEMLAIVRQERMIIPTAIKPIAAAVRKALRADDHGRDEATISSYNLLRQSSQ